MKCAGIQVINYEHHPELYYWHLPEVGNHDLEGCKVKLTPFVTITEDTIPCDCRRVYISFHHIPGVQYYHAENGNFTFSSDHISAIFRNWKMLTEVHMEYHDALYQLAAQSDPDVWRERFALNLTADHFRAEKMRSMLLLRLQIIDIDYQQNGLPFLSKLELLELEIYK